jgi:hypothetical protein
MNTGKIKLMECEHPDIKLKRLLLAAFIAQDIYVESDSHDNSITIFNPYGDLKYNIYRPNRRNKNVCHYNLVVWGDDTLLALYFYIKGEKKSAQSTKSPVFDAHTGDYIPIQETVYRIKYFYSDKENNRILLFLDAYIQFAYPELDRLVKYIPERNIYNPDRNIYDPNRNIYDPNEKKYVPDGKIYDPNGKIDDPNQKKGDPYLKIYDPKRKIYDPNGVGVVNIPVGVVNNCVGVVNFSVRVVNKADNTVN